MRGGAAIVSILKEEHNIEVVGGACSFAETMQMVGDFRPDASSRLSLSDRN